MTKILLLTDIHGKYDTISDFMECDPDIVIIAGDITDCGDPQEANEVLRQIDVPCFAIPGNCDLPEILNVIEYSDAVNLHGTSLEIGNTTFTGVGGSNPTPFNTPFELSEEELCELLEKAKKRGRQNVHNVLICHAPPYCTLDDIGGTHVGCKCFRDNLSDFDLVCCGHIHDHTGAVDIEGTLVVNPGPASEGKYAVITLGDEPKEIEVELLTL
ncbi:metallophosphoesterase [Methanogenium marinum]|uniref:Metallophosphoesterase n=1 Tax=Methanogenium marinum TaxID=348610 RepID=A0A9Q4KMB6_9EURY|nr:metallophosphoesterase [Methanogenium marinum]MDE4907098.1 metallophosphoesterase [Methanogenium marinum]